MKTATLAAAATQAALGAESQPLQSRSLAFVGTRTEKSSQGIYVSEWDAAPGKLSEPKLAVKTDFPTFLALSPDRRYLFAANEDDHNGAVSSFAIDRTRGTLQPISRSAAEGGGTCHITLDATGRTLLCANYGTGSATSFQVDEQGRISKAVSHFQYAGHGPNPDRQAGPHAHRVTVTPGNDFVLVNDLGLDRLHFYRLDAATATLTPAEPPEWKTAPGSGPRALRFHPNGRWVYCVFEMGSSVSLYHWDPKGSLSLVQTADLVPPDFTGRSQTAEIAFDRQGRFAYVSNRYDDFLATFLVSATDGTLTLVRRSSCGGKVPRYLTLDPTGKWLLVTNQDSDNVAIFARDPGTGDLANTGSSVALSIPQCIVFA